MTFAEVETAVDHWFAERIACGQIAQHTEAYNQAFAARDDLKKRLGVVLGALEPKFPPLPVTDAATQPSAAPEAATEE